MKFNDLSKESQDILIDRLNVQIEEHANTEGIKDYTEPSGNEYAAFFDAYGNNYEMNGDISPESTNLGRDHRTYGISFNNSHAVLEVYPSGKCNTK